MAENTSNRKYKATSINYKTIRILNVLSLNKCFSPMITLSRKQIIDKLDDNKPCKDTVFRHISLLLDIGYIAEGYKDNKEMRYYLTQDGKDFITKELSLNNTIIQNENNDVNYKLVSYEIGGNINE